MTGVETVRTANRLAPNEDQTVRLVGLATEVAGRAAVLLDRPDAVVPIAEAGKPIPDGWDSDDWAATTGRIIAVEGRLTRHAERNDSDTGMSALMVTGPTVSAVDTPDDGRVRTMPELQAAEGAVATVEGLAYRSRSGNVVVVAGGLAYVDGFHEWDDAVVGNDIAVTGEVHHDDLPPDAPAAGGSWRVHATDVDVVSP